MGRTTAKAKKPTCCTNCTGTALVRRVTTYPVRLTGPAPLTGKEIHVHRVALHQCQSCGHLMPTPAGQAKVERCVERGIEFFLGRLS
jgi:hypothetical protein